MELFTPLFCDFTDRPFPHFPFLGHAKSTRLAFHFPQTADPPAPPRTADPDPPQNEVLDGPLKVIHHARLSELHGRGEGHAAGALRFGPGETSPFVRQARRGQNVCIL